MPKSLCIKNYYNRSGKLVFEAEKTYEWQYATKRKTISSAGPNYSHTATGNFFTGITIAKRHISIQTFCDHFKHN